MPTKVPVDLETEALLRRLARETGSTQADVLREAVAAYGAERGSAASLFERMQHVVGTAPAGLTNLSSNTGGKFVDLLRGRQAKFRAQRHAFTAILEREGNRFAALCPELDVASQGGSVEEATANLIEAADLFLESADPEEIARRVHSEVFITTFETARR